MMDVRYWKTLSGLNGKAETPFYHLVPKDPKANHKFRREMVKLGYSDPKAAHELWIMCARDFFFYVNTFVWTYDPKNFPDNPIRPMNTWEFQDDFLWEIIQSIGKHDVVNKKSRDMAATTGIVTVYQWRWGFHPGQQFIMVSRNEKYVDKPRDPKTLFWKIDFILENNPKWLRPNYTRTYLNIYNEDNKSSINGESTTGDIGRGSKPTSILMDEFQAFEVQDGYKVLSATRDATRNRIFNFTSGGIGNAAYDVSQNASMKQIRLHWSIHPDKKPGLYSSDNGKLCILDDKYIFPTDYPFILDGKLRSPWYDEQCRRAAHSLEIAQELDMDDQASSYPFFDLTTLDYLKKNFTLPAFSTGILTFNSDSATPIEFVDDSNGHLKLWINLNNGQIPDGKYVAGVDTAAGTGASNSSVSIANRYTKEKVAEYSNPFILPEEFAIATVALCRWFNDAFLIWESNGPGRSFGEKVEKIGYSNIYFRQNETSLSHKQTDTPGWFPTTENKHSLLSNYRFGLGLYVNGILNHQDYLVRSERSLTEATEYIRMPDGSIEHVKSITNSDPSGASKNHGDMVIADALVWKVIGNSTDKIETTEEVPIDCLAARRKARQDNEREYW